MVTWCLVSKRTGQIVSHLVGTGPGDVAPIVWDPGYTATTTPDPAELDRYQAWLEGPDRAP